MFSTIRQDLGFAIRQLRRRHGFALTAVLTLALGIGATTAVFSLVDGILLRPLAFPDSDRLVAIDALEFPPGAAGTSGASANEIRGSYPDFFEWQRQNRTFESLASSSCVMRLFSKTNGEGARVIPACRVSANLFSTLGATPAVGRLFSREEEQGGHRVVILSHELWVSDFGSSPEAIGQTVKISDELSTIVGVMPAGFHYPVDELAYFWTTFAADAEGPNPVISQRSWNRLSVLGRMKPGVSLEQARADLDSIQRAVAQQYPEERDKRGVAIARLLDDAVSDVRPALTLLLLAVSAVLIIACANVSGLLLARGSGRRSELALRTALGASRARVLRQLLTEGVLLASLGGALGIVLAVGLLRAGLNLIPSSIPRLYNVAVEGRVLIFAVALSAVAAIASSLLPAWRMSRSDPADSLREGQATATRGPRAHRVHHAIIVAETAITFMLLVGSGMLIRSMMNVLRIKPGFDTEHTLSFDIALTEKRYPDPSKVLFFEKLLPQLAVLPGVKSASAAHPLPIYWSRSSWATFTIPEHPTPPDNPPGAITAVAEPGYFETLSIPLVRGRTFNAHDNNPKSAPVAVINESFARRYFPAEDPIGHYFVPKFDEAPPLGRQIVGIVGDTRNEDISNPYEPEFFLPYAQEPTHQRPPVVLKVEGNPLIYEGAVRRVVANLDKDAPVFRFRTFTGELAMQAAEPRFQAILVSAFGTVALLLAAVGLYSILSCLVSERTREIGLRLALGASRSDVLQLIMQRGVLLTCIGIVIGALGAFLGRDLISSMLFRVTPFDKRLFATVGAVLVAVSIVAALAPSLRAASVDPIRTLREQ